MKHIIESLKLATLPTFMLLLISPLTFYYGNINEVSFNLYDIWQSIVVLLLVTSLSLFLLLIIIRKFKKLHFVLSGILLGISASIWIQSQIFVWNFGPLDGRGIDWSQWSMYMVFESIIWIAFITFCTSLFLKNNEKATKLITRTLFALGIISIFVSIITVPEINETNKKQFSNPEKFFQFHPENNTIIIMLDTFQSNYLEFIAEKYPSEVAFLDGFTFYRNTIGKYPTTAPSIPAIMTNSIYENQKPIDDYIKNSYQKYNITSAYKEKNYKTYNIGNPNDPESISRSDILDALSISQKSPISSFLDYGIFRAAPTLLKKHIYNNGDWLFAFLLQNEYPPKSHGDDVRFLKLLEKKAEVAGNTQSGVFAFYHFFIPHPPWRVDEKLNYNDNLSGTDGYIRQARGAIKIVKRIMDKFHKLGIYESSEIIIMSDHGTRSVPPPEGEEHSSVLNDVPERVQSSSLALLLHKKPFASGKMVIDDSPLALNDLSCLLGITRNNLECKRVKTALNGVNRTRRYLFYDWKNEYWNRDFMPNMAEYFVDGHAYKTSSWQKGNYIFKPERKIKRDKYFYQIGKVIHFSEKGLSEHIIRGGWAHQEPNHRWTIGPKAGMAFSLKNEPDNDLLIRINAFPYLARGEIKRQIVGVTVNGEKLVQWNMQKEKWYEAEIPTDLVGKDSILKVVFDISNPASPAEFGHSSDSRKLGMGVRKLVIEEAGN